MPPLPRGAPIPGRIGETEFPSAGPKKLTNRMSRHLSEGHLDHMTPIDIDQEALKQFLMEHGDNPEVMDMLAGRFGMEPGSINFPGITMPSDPQSTLEMPDLPTGAPEMSMMQPEGARTPAPQIAGGGLSGGRANEIAQRSELISSILSQISTDELQQELFRRIQG